MPRSAQEAIDQWVVEPQNTARSVIATIFGDTISPVGNSIWLAQLFQLTNVFGFSPRLVRTSLYRLAEEGWCSNERVGRQSRYSLTDLAIQDTKEAEQRIYNPPQLKWSGQWTVAFVDAPTLPEEAQISVSQRLKWQGFLPLSQGILASPTVTVSQAREICDRATPDHKVPLANLAFTEIEELVATDFFVEALLIEDRAKAYTSFVSFYESLAIDTIDPASCFALRTMFVHDLRRIRLSGPDIPVELLPDDWPGTQAFDVANTLYPALCKKTGPWLSSVLEADYPEVFEDRFK